MQTIFSTNGAEIQCLEKNDTFIDFADYKKGFTSRQRETVREVARNGALTAQSLIWIFSDLSKPERSCKEALNELYSAGVLARLEIWHGEQRSGVAYAISSLFKERFGKKVSVLRYLEETPKTNSSSKLPEAAGQLLRKIDSNTTLLSHAGVVDIHERRLTVEEQLEWLSIASLVSGATKVTYKTNKLFPLARIRNGSNQLSYAVISCRQNQELLPRLLFLIEQLSGRGEWRGIVIFESFNLMQQGMAKVMRELERSKIPIYGTYDRACIDSQILYRIEYIPGTGTRFVPVKLQGGRRAK